MTATPAASAAQNVHPSSNAAASIEPASPRIATRTAIPTTAPIWRAVALTAVAVPRRSSGTAASAALPSAGNARPTPAPTSTMPGSHSATNCVVAPVWSANHPAPAASSSAPGATTARSPKRAVIRGASPAAITATSGAGVTARPASSTDSRHTVVRNRTLHRIAA